MVKMVAELEELEEKLTLDLDLGNRTTFFTGNPALYFIVYKVSIISIK